MSVVRFSFHRDSFSKELFNLFYCSTSILIKQEIFTILHIRTSNNSNVATGYKHHTKRKGEGMYYFLFREGGARWNFPLVFII